MVRRKLCLIFAMMLLLPTKTICQDEDVEELDNEDDAADKNEAQEDTYNRSNEVQLRTPSPIIVQTPVQKTEFNDTRVKMPFEMEQLGHEVPAEMRGQLEKERREVSAPFVLPDLSLSYSKSSIECYVCRLTPQFILKACLDPLQYRVHTMTCPTGDQCYTSIIKDSREQIKLVSRGCRARCVNSLTTTCCEGNYCNSQAELLIKLNVGVESFKHAVAPFANKTDKSIPPTVLFFVTILLLLQTVVKVSI